jgi:anti-sigma B factor antagonist
MHTKHTSRWLERADLGDVTVVRLKMPRTLPEDFVKGLFDTIFGLIGETGRCKLVLNFAGAEFLSSMALGKLVLLQRKAQAGRGRVALCQLSPAVKETLEGTDLASLFDIYGAEQQAVQSFLEPVSEGDAPCS